MPLFEVVLRYAGQSTYFVESTDREAAIEIAKGRYANGENSDHAGDTEELTGVDCEIAEVTD